jgi:hypothetical protein
VIIHIRVYLDGEFYFNRLKTILHMIGHLLDNGYDDIVVV